MAHLVPISNHMNFLISYQLIFCIETIILGKSNLLNLNKYKTVYVLQVMVLIERIVVRNNYFQAWHVDLLHVLMPF